jgi:PAS domain S-box-containing protein
LPPRQTSNHPPDLPSPVSDGSNPHDTAERLARLEARIKQLQQDDFWQAWADHLEVVAWRRGPDDSLAVLAGPVQPLTGLEEAGLRSGQVRWDDRIHPDDRSLVVASRARARQSGASSRVDYRIVGDDGRARWVRETARFVADHSGRTCLDGMVSSSAGTEANGFSPTESQAPYRALVDSALIGIYVHQDDRFVYVNHRLAEIFGYDSPEEMIGMTPWDLVHPKDRDLVRDRSAGRDGMDPVQGRYVFRGLRRDGTDVWIEIHPSVVSFKGQPARIGHLIDVTAEHRIEAELERRQVVFDVLFRTTPLSVALVDQDGLISGVNPAFEKLFGHGGAEARGRTVDELIAPPETLDECRQYTGMTLDQRQVTQAEGTRIRKDGSRVRVLMSASPVIVDGVLRGAFVTYTDVTERHRTEEALRTGYERLRALNRLSLVATRSLAPQEFVAAVLDELEGIDGVESPSLFIWDQPRRRLDLAGARGLSTRFFAHLEPIELGQGATGSAARVRRPLFIDDYQTWPGATDETKEEGVASLAVVPLLARDRLLGTLNILRRRLRPFSQEEKDLFVSIGQILSASLANTQLYAEVRESERRFQDVADFTGDWIWEMDADGICTYSSPAVKRVSGLEADAIIGRHFSEFFPAESRDETARRIIEIFHSRDKVDGLISTIGHADGHEVILETFGRQLLNDQGDLIGFRGVHRDVTEQRQAWSAVRASEEKYRHLVTEIQEGFYETDLEGRITFANPALGRLIGAPSESLLGMDHRVFVAAEDKPRVFSAVNRTFHTGRPVRTLECDMVSHRGEIRRVEASADLITDETGRKIGFRGVIRDITARRWAETMLRASEEKYRSLIERAPIGIRITQEGRGVYFNPQWLSMFGLKDADSVLGRPVSDFYHPDDRPLVRDREESLLAGAPGPVEFEARRLTPDDKTIILGHRLTKVVYEGRPAILAFVEDITARKEAEREREVFQSRLAEANKMESIGRLAGGIAHDFNNILEGILGYASLAKDKLEDRDQVGRALDIIENSALRAAELTQQLLGFARRGKDEIRPMDLRSLVERVLTLIGRTFDRAIDVATAIPEDLKAVPGDPGQIENCLLNLCINARDAMPRGGRLTIEVGNVFLDDAKARSLAGLRPGEYVQVSVTDTGVGIEAGHQGRIFEPFFTTKDGGTGLGLAMAYGIIRNHDGHIEVSSRPGEGSTFRFFLPATELPAVEAEEAPTGPEVLAGGRETILVVDDEEVIRSFAHEVLTELGYRVLLAEDGTRACELFGEMADRIDLVILDLVMPGLSGLEALKVMLNIQPQVTVLLSSGYSGGQRIDEMLAAGAKGLLRKPYRMVDLAAKVRDILDN